MARLRMIKPSFATDSRTGKLDMGPKLLLILLWCHCDGFGVCDLDYETIGVVVFPYHQNARRRVAEWMHLLEGAGLLQRFSVAGRVYHWVVGFCEDQKPSSRGEPLLPGWSVDTTPTTYPDALLLSPEAAENIGRYSPISDDVLRGGGGKGMGEGTREHHVAAPAAVDQVWEHYLEKRPKAILSEKRRKVIRARLAEGFTADRLCRAIDGNYLSPFHCGQNDREREYHELELILRDAEHVEQFEEIIDTKEREERERIEQRRADLRLIGREDVL